MSLNEDEINLILIEEKQKILESRLKDVDECCGKLKGTINAEMRIVNERIVGLEHGVTNNCKEVEIQMKGLEEQNKTLFRTDDKLLDDIEAVEEKLDKKISKITGYYMSFTLGILGSMAIGLIALLK